MSYISFVVSESRSTILGGIVGLLESLVIKCGLSFWFDLLSSEMLNVTISK